MREDPGWMSENITGLVTNVSHNTNGQWITVKKDSDACCHTPQPLREVGTEDLRRNRGALGEGDRAQSASPSDVEEGQRVHAFPSDSIAPEYPPAAGADKVVILAPQ